MELLDPLPEKLKNILGTTPVAAVVVVEGWGFVVGEVVFPEDVIDEEVEPDDE